MNKNSLNFKAKFVTLLLALCPILGLSQSKYVATNDETLKTADFIVSLAATGSLTAALAEIRPYMGGADGDFKVAEAQFDSQSNEIFRVIGKPVGYEIANTEKLGTSLIRYTYIIKCVNSAIIWKMTFYKTARGWSIIDFNFNSHAKSIFPN